MTEALAATPCHSLTSVSWLNGHWQYQGDGQKVRESWWAVSENTMEGEGQTRTTSNERVSAETLRIVAMSNMVFYLAKVDSNLLPIAFKLIDCESNRLVFENKEHDFPQTIIYQLVDDNHIHVKVLGKDNTQLIMDYIRQ